MDLKGQYDRLLRYCLMKTKDRYRAEDITQETFLRFWQNRSYEDTGKEMAYLYTIARNLCMDEFRRKVPESLEDHPELDDRSSEDSERSINRIVVESALNELPEDLREVVVLRYMSEVSAADIGKILHMSRFSVNRRCKEALAKLRSILEGGECK